MLELEIENIFGMLCIRLRNYIRAIVDTLPGNLLVFGLRKKRLGLHNDPSGPLDIHHLDSYPEIRHSRNNCKGMHNGK